MESSNIGFKMINVVLGFRELNQAFIRGDSDKTLGAISVMINALRCLRRVIRAGKNELAFYWGKEAVENETKSN